MNSIWNDLLYLLGQAFLQRLRYLGIASSVRHFASVRVATSVVEGIGHLALDVAGYLHLVSSRGGG